MYEYDDFSRAYFPDEATVHGLGRLFPKCAGIFAVPAWVPVAGFLVSLGFQIAALLHFVAG